MRSRGSFQEGRFRRGASPGSCAARVSVLTVVPQKIGGAPIGLRSRQPLLLTDLTKGTESRQIGSKCGNRLQSSRSMADWTHIRIPRKGGPVAERRFLTLADVGEVLNISSSQTYALVRSGELPAIQVGGRGQWRVETRVLEEYIVRAYEKTASAVKNEAGSTPLARSNVQRDLEPASTLARPPASYDS